MKSHRIGVSFREKHTCKGYILELIAGFLNKRDGMYMDYREMSIQRITFKRSIGLACVVRFFN